MRVPRDTFDAVRQRAGYACEYCGVREVEARGLLTVDHFDPDSAGGSSEPDNLVYACYRCNLYKAAYRAERGGGPALWNPRLEPQSAHLIELPDGRMLAVTECGRLTIQRLRLNREQAVQARLEAQRDVERRELLRRLRDAVEAFGRIQSQRADRSEEYREYLQEQNRLFRAMDELSGEE